MLISQFSTSTSAGFIHWLVPTQNMNERYWLHPMSPGSYILKPALSVSHCLSLSPLLEHGFLNLGTKPTGHFRASINLLKLHAKLCAWANVHFSRAVDLWLTSYSHRGGVSEEANRWMDELMNEWIRTANLTRPRSRSQSAESIQRHVSEGLCSPVPPQRNKGKVLNSLASASSSVNYG